MYISSMINYLYAKFFYRFYSKDFDKDRAKNILKNLRRRSKELVSKTPEEIISVLSKSFLVGMFLNILMMENNLIGLLY